MSDTFTPNLNLTKPAVGASRDTWGTKTNSDWDLVDAVFAGAGSGTSVGLNVGSGKTLSVAGTLTASGTVTLPAAATAGGATIVSTTGTQTLTNKTLTNPAINGFTGDTSVINVGSGQIYKDASGNVGIGTSAPASPLQVAGTVRFGAGPSDATNATVIMYSDGTGISIEAFQGNNSATKRDLWINAYGGNVGIGTTAPTAPLDVNGNVAITGTARRITGDFSNATNASRTLFQTNVVNNNSNVGIMPNGSGVSSNLLLYGGSDPDNASVAQLGMTNSGTEARIGSFATGTGTVRPITFVMQGAERMRIDTSGNVGIGTSSPSQRLAVSGQISSFVAGASILQTAIDTANSINWQVGSDGANIYAGTQTNHALRLTTNNTERMRITAAGNVGIGTTAPDTSLGVNGGIRARGGAPGAGGVNNNGYSFGGGNGDTDGGMFSSADGQVEFYSNSVERARINAVGNFRIGTTAFTGATESRLAVSGTSGATWAERTVTLEHTGGNQPGIGFHAPTSFVAGIFKFAGPAARFECRNDVDSGFLDIAANSCISVSDYRLKENIAPFSGGLSAVMQLNPVTFKWKDKDRAAVGFVAHEVQAAIPTAITGVKDEMYDESTPAFQGIDPLQIVAVLTKAVQELTAKLEAAEARIANLENR